ncbi:retrotransposon protein, putative, ty1-copia subclass [Tanacetum coccineum]
MDNGAILVSKDNIFYFNAFLRDGIFDIDMHDNISNEHSIYTCSNKKSKHNLDSTFLWHCCLGHINKKRIKKLQHDGLLKSIDDESFDVCVSCISGKMARKPFTHASERAADLLGIIHSDVCRLLRTTSREGANYYVTFTDDFSRCGYVYLIKHKHEVFEMFKTFQNKVENQLEKNVKALRSDRGGEYLSQEFLDHLRIHGIISQLTPSYTPQHNGVSKRRNQTLLDMVRSMMSLTTFPMSFWGYALESVARILNMVPTKKVNKTPYKMWHVKGLNLSYLKVWGCEALVKRDTPNKLDSRSIKCILIGYPEEIMGYYFYYPLENKFFVARSARIPQAPERYGFYIDAEEHKLGDHGEPPNYGAELSDPESKKWLEAINAEMQSMKDNQVWNLVDLPPNYKTVGSKWLFKKKTDMDSNIHTYKARLVAKGFTQTYGVDYEETFSPVADIKAIRILIAIAAYYDYEIWKMDVKTAFLNGRLNEDVYMVHPEGFVNPKHPERVCMLQRFIYGLKQASRSWNKRFDEEIISAYIDKTLKMYKMDTSKRGTIPMQPNVDLSNTQGPSTPAEVKQMKEIPYASAKVFWTAVKNILKYLINTKDMFLVYGGDSITELGVTCYTDASWETDKDDLRSQTGFVFVMNGGAIDWKSSKQSTTIMSLMEAKYIAAAEAVMEAIWIRKFIFGLGVVPSIDRPMDMYYDNTGAITIADEPGVQRDDNLANQFTKPMPCTKHVEHARSIGLRPASNFM